MKIIYFQNMITVFLIIFTIFSFNNCTKYEVPAKEIPKCIKKKISEIKKEPVRNPPGKVFEWEYDGEIVYYIPPYCCDIPSELYDKNCNLICRPDGGISGGGDGKCPVLYIESKKLIWEDDR